MRAGDSNRLERSRSSGHPWLRTTGHYLLTVIGLAWLSVIAGTAQERGLAEATQSALMFAWYGWFTVPVLVVVAVPALVGSLAIVAVLHGRRLACSLAGGLIWIGYFTFLDATWQDVLRWTATAPLTVVEAGLIFLAGAAFCIIQSESAVLQPLNGSRTRWPPSHGSV